ncbi:hypothetical protein MIR68_003944 [Amoeboaphelidium protococcarum]|nr:hypothetical protein MIR68_003944 [Amoeboaphelidium protococcarum]
MTRLMDSKKSSAAKGKSQQQVLVDVQGDLAQSFVVVPTDPQSSSLTVLDNRTGKSYQIPIDNGHVKATDFEQIKKSSDDQDGLRLYDPAYQNTAVAKSAITYIDGDNGILLYRGYPIEELAEKSNFLEVAYLLIYGQLPDQVQYQAWSSEILRHTFVHTRLADLMSNFNYDAHPMSMYISGISSMSAFHPEANPALQGNDLYKKNPKILNKQIFRILGKAPTLAAMSYRHRIGRPYNLPKNGLDYTENFLYMLDHLNEEEYRPNPRLARALDILFILHADHEMNCSTAAMRHISSSLVDPYSAVAGSCAALYGPLHGGATQSVVLQLIEIGSVDNVPQFIEDVKNKKRKLMGFGHRIYTTFDPRSKIIRRLAYEVFEIVGKEPLIDIALKLEEAALNDEYFIKRKLYPNVDFYSGIIYKAMGFPLDFFPVLFAIPRICGYLAHWKESLEDQGGKIWRPRQVYVGAQRRSYQPLELRESARQPNQPDSAYIKTLADHHPFSKRTMAASWEGNGKNGAIAGGKQKSKL